MTEFKKKLFAKYRVAKIKFQGGYKPKGREEIRLYELKDKIDRCVANLTEPYSSVFTRTYLENNSRLWWDGLYATCTYYRYLKSAREQFFTLFYGGRL